VSEDNSLRIDNVNEMIKIDAEVDIYFYGKLKVATGHVLADLTSVHSNLAVSFGT